MPGPRGPETCCFAHDALIKIQGTAANRYDCIEAAAVTSSLSPDDFPEYQPETNCQETVPASEAG